MAYLLTNSYTKNYWNRTIIVKIIDGGWVVSFFETQCSWVAVAPNSQQSQQRRTTVCTRHNCS